MTMTPALRRSALTLHVTTSVGWFGAVASVLALAVAGLAGTAPQHVRAAYIAMQLIAGVVIVPLAIASLVSGIVQSRGTPWSLFRHHWIVAKLFLAVIATIVLLLKLKTISYMGGAAAIMPALHSGHHAPKLELLVHSAGGLAVLFVAIVLSIYKPWGRTTYG